MNDIISKILQKYGDGATAVLATVVQSSGSTPRGAGARMAVFSDGVCFGTVGGGSVEFESQKLARVYLENRESAVKDFYLHPNEVADLGMICGGDVTVHFQYLAPSERLTSFLEYVSGLCKAGDEAWLITAFDDKNGWSMAVADEEGHIAEHFGDFSASELDPELLGPRSELKTDGACYTFVQPLRISGDAYIFGGGHVSQQLVPFLDMVFFPCTVVDDSDEFANPERFPLAREIIITEFERAFEKIDVGGDDYIVIVTRGHVYDYTILAQALKTRARYIGMIGSRKKNDAVFQKLILEDGFTVTDLRRVHAPIGLSIGGETPEEIALAIAAQMVQVRSKPDDKGR
ncbi:MAG: XdhC family protein [Peptococcaceae bacterium]|jgi:xanthine dehydrogenase accessory factor|nr:XdhC family protein [Peptococcaceae bacterium]